MKPLTEEERKILPNKIAFKEVTDFLKELEIIDAIGSKFDEKDELTDESSKKCKDLLVAMENSILPKFKLIFERAKLFKPEGEKEIVTLNSLGFIKESVLRLNEDIKLLNKQKNKKDIMKTEVSMWKKLELIALPLETFRESTFFIRILRKSK